MMPLWITAMRPPETCGWALASVTPPWVAQRVWAMPVVPVSVWRASFASSCATLPTARTGTTGWPGCSTATPAES